MLCRSYIKGIHCVKLNQVTVPAIDVAESVEFYVRMGLELIVSSSHYARFVCSDGDSSFSVHLVPQLLPWSGTVVYFEVQSLDQKVRDLQDRGIAFTQEPRDEPWLWREARLLDPSGNVICLYTAGVNRLNPPWRLQSNTMG